MTLAYVIDGGLNDVPGNGADLYERYPAVRELYASIEGWTDIPVARLLSWDLPTQQEFREVGAIRQAAVALGLCDVLAEHSVHPDVAGGLSLGGRIGACIAGALSRRDLFTILAELRHAPPPAGEPQGVAALVLPVDADLDEMVRARLGPRLHLAAELGVLAGGRDRMLLVAGYRGELEDLAARMPKGTVRIPRDVVSAYHSPLSQHLVDFLDPAVLAASFHDPVIPLCSCVAVRTLRTAAQVREEFRRNPISRVSLPHVLDGFERHGVELALLLGPAQVDLFLENPQIPVVHVESPDHIAEALTAVHEFGLAQGVRR
jgi:[acyl-carrier-protein] S-malonyltransferase